jgi:hypothetical protein
MNVHSMSTLTGFAQQNLSRAARPTLDVDLNIENPVCQAERLTCSD